MEDLISLLLVLLIIYSFLIGFTLLLISKLYKSYFVCGIKTKEVYRTGSFNYSSGDSSVHTTSYFDFKTKDGKVVASITITVNEKSLSDVNYNIKVGCMIFQTAMKYMDYNPLASIQCYNMGYGNMKKILNAYSVESGKSVNSILSDITDKGWMDYRYLIKEGDREYIENVLSWLGEDINITNKKDNGTEVCFKVNSTQNNKSIH